MQKADDGKPAAPKPFYLTQDADIMECSAINAVRHPDKALAQCVPYAGAMRMHCVPAAKGSGKLRQELEAAWQGSCGQTSAMMQSFR